MTQQYGQRCLALGTRPSGLSHRLRRLVPFSARLGRASPEKARPALPAGARGTAMTALASEPGGRLLRSVLEPGSGAGGKGLPGTCCAVRVFPEPIQGQLAFSPFPTGPELRLQGLAPLRGGAFWGICAPQSRLGLGCCSAVLRGTSQAWKAVWWHVLPEPPSSMCTGCWSQCTVTPGGVPGGVTGHPRGGDGPSVRGGGRRAGHWGPFCIV